MVYFPLNSPFIFTNRLQFNSYIKHFDNTDYVARSGDFGYPTQFDTFAFFEGQKIYFQFSAPKEQAIGVNALFGEMQYSVNLTSELKSSIKIYTADVTVPLGATSAMMQVCNEGDVYFSQKFPVLAEYSREYWRVTASDSGFKNGSLFGGEASFSYDFLVKMEPPTLSNKVLLDTFADEIGGVTTIKRQIQRQLQCTVLHCMDVIAERIAFLVQNKYLAINGVTGHLSDLKIEDIRGGVQKISFSIQINNSYQIVQGQSYPVDVLGANAEDTLSDKDNRIILI